MKNLVPIVTVLLLWTVPHPAKVQGSAAQGSRLALTSRAASFLNLGARAYQVGRFEEARQDLEQAIRLDPRSARAHALLGLTLAREENLKEALTELRAAYAIDPASHDYAYNYALLLLQEKHFTAAIPILERLRRQSPQAEDVSVNLARAYYGAADFGKLRALASSLPATAYGDEALLKAIVDVLAQAKQVLAVEDVWTKAIRLVPRQPLPYAALAELWVQRGEAKRSLALLERAPSAARGPVWLYAFAQTELALGNYGEASESFQELTRLVPDNQRAWQELIRAELMGGHPARAEATAEAAIRRFPTAGEFRYQEAVIDYVLGRAAAAIEAITPVLQSEGGKDPRLLLLMAVLQSQTGNYQEATRYFERLAKLGSGCNTLASYFYGVTLLRMHRPRNAVAQFNDAVRCQPHFGVAEFRLGQALAQSGNLRGALSALRQATEDDAKLAEPYYALAQLCRRLGDTAGAEAALVQFNRRHQHVDASDRNLLQSGLR